MSWDLSLDSCLGHHNHQSLEGKLDLELEFAEGTTSVLNVLIICIYENVISIDGGNVSLNYTV